MKTTMTTKFATTALLASTSIAERTPASMDESAAYKFQVSAPSNKALDGAIVTLQDDSSKPSEPQRLGVWQEDRMARDPWSFKVKTNTDDDRFYTVHSSSDESIQLAALGSDIALNLSAVPSSYDSSAQNQKGQEFSAGYWRFAEPEAESKTKYPSMFNANPKYSAPGQEPWGGAGSWRACREDKNKNEWTLVWFDGLNDPKQYCPNIEGGISFLAVPVSAASNTTTLGGNGTTTPSGTPISGATALNRSNGWGYLGGLVIALAAASVGALI